MKINELYHETDLHCILVFPPSKEFLSPHFLGNSTTTRPCSPNNKEWFPVPLDFIFEILKTGVVVSESF